MITNAVVIETNGKKALVRATRGSACEGCSGCSKKGECHTELLFSDSSRTYILEVDNEIGASSGDRCLVESKGNGVLLFAVLVFLVPIIATAVAYIVADMLIEGIWVYILSAAVFVGVFVGISVFSNKIIGKFTANKICKIIKENG